MSVSPVKKLWFKYRVTIKTASSLEEIEVMALDETMASFTGLRKASAAPAFVESVEEIPTKNSMFRDNNPRLFATGIYS